MASELINRRHEADQAGADAYYPRPPKRWLSASRPMRYMLREQRLIFVLVGIAIATLAFTIFPRSTRSISYSDPFAGYGIKPEESHVPAQRRPSVEYRSRIGSTGGKIPLGLKRKGLRVVVTGGAGFVGSHLVDRLMERGDTVIVVDNFFTGSKENVMHHFGNPNFELIRHDVVEPILLEVDQIYHLACPASPVHYKFNPVKTIKTNVVGTLNMLGLAKRVGARFLLTSTSEVYGDPLQHPQVETYWGNVNPIGVRSCYDEGKRTAETLAMDYHRGANVEVRIARIFNTYGPRMCIDDGRVVSNFVAQALRKEPMTVYGDGKQTRSFQFVSDLVEGLMRLMEGEHVGPFNLGNPGEFTMLELAKVVQETIDPNANIEFRPNTEDDPHKRKPDITKAKELLGWEPKVSLRQGLPLMVKDFRQRIFGDQKEGSSATATTTLSLSLSLHTFLLGFQSPIAAAAVEILDKLVAMEVTQLLLNAQSIDGTVRKHAEENLKLFQSQNLAGFLLSLAGELANDEKPVDSRKLAGLVLKNALDAKEQHRKYELVQRWLSLDMATKTQIRAFLLKTLSSPVPDVRSTASQVIAKVAGIELPQNQWPELVGSLLSNIHQLPAHVKQATLETLGYLCEEVSPDVVEQEHVNKILTAVVQGMNSAEGNNDVRLAATRALYMALGFAQANFNNDMERDYIMRVVCEATLSPEVKIRQAAFECLVSIASTYYEKLAHYMQDIFNITAKAVREDDESVALQAIEFWSSICDEEIDILEEYGGEFTGDSDVPCFYFTKQALPALVPLLLETLLKQEEDQDLDEGAWNIAMAGGTCLGLVARAVGDDIVPHVMPFIEEKISKPDWREREAATYAFGSILEGPSPDKLMTIVNAALTFMLNALTKDPSNHVKDTTAWTLGRMFEFLHGSTIETPIITQANCQQIITVLIQTMKDAPNVAEKACGALYFLAQGYEDIGPNSPLTPFFQEIIQSLLAVAHREDATESRLRTAAYEALNEVVRCSTDETSTMVLQLVPVIMLELHNTLEGEKLSSDEREKQNELQGLLCGCLQVIIQKLGSEPTKYVFMQHADQMMGLFLRVFGCRSATAHEEAMLAIGALAYAAGPDFAKYMPEFYKYLEMGLQNFEEYQVCAVTVGVIGDICRALEDKILPYCDGIMTQLLKDLSSNQLHRSVKPPIFSCFGDIALAIGENFEKYINYSMPMLQSAAELSAHASGADDEMTEYTNSLRNGILEAYSGIFQGFKNSPKTQLLIPYAPHILQFLDSIYMEKDMDEVVMKTAIGVLGDLADTLGSHVGGLIQQSVSSKEFLNECLSSDDHTIKEAAEWAKHAITRAISV